MPIDAERARAISALRFRALGDETRLRILELLATGERTVSELQHGIEVGQSLMSHHLRILREAGIVADRREGRWVYYGIVEPALAAAKLTLYELDPIRSHQGDGLLGTGSRPRP
jgi:ArsR family transcriptional regulator